MAGAARRAWPVDRQPPPRAGGCLHRLAWARPRRASARSRRAGVRRARLRGRGRWRRGARVRTPRHRHDAWAQGGHRAAGQRVLWRAQRRAVGGGGHRHQRQDVDRVVDGPRLVCAGPLVRHRRHPRCRRRTRRRHRRDSWNRAGTDRLDHPRPGDAAPDLSPPRRRGLRRLRGRGLVDRPGRAAAVGHPHRRGGVQQFHPGSPRLPRLHGGLLASQAGIVRLAGSARGGRQHRRSAGSRVGCGAGRRRARLVDLFGAGLEPSRRACAAVRAIDPLRRRRPRVRSRRGRVGGRFAAHAVDRRLQRVEPAGRRRLAACAGRDARRCGAGVRRLAAGTRSHAAGRVGGLARGKLACRRCSSTMRTRPMRSSRRCAPCSPWPMRAGACCGACSAAAAIATRASGR